MSTGQNLTTWKSLRIIQTTVIIGGSIFSKRKIDTANSLFCISIQFLPSLTLITLHMATLSVTGLGGKPWIFFYYIHLNLRYVPVTAYKSVMLITYYVILIPNYEKRFFHAKLTKYPLYIPITYKKPILLHQNLECCFFLGPLTPYLSVLTNFL